jgi:ABC-2 type transport system permease protein
MIVKLVSASPSVRSLRLFQRLRFTQLHNAGRGVWRDAPVRPLTILFCGGVVWFGVFGISLAAFRYLERWIPLTGDIINLVLNVMFLTLALLLVFSSAIILYSSLFSSAESAFLLSTPAPADQVFAYKFQSAVGFSSWAFIVLASPVLMAYGIQARLDWPFYAFLPFFFLGYILVPGSLGALACLLVVNFVPKRRKQVIIAGLILFVVVASVTIYQTIMAAQTQTPNRELLNQLLGRFRFARYPLFPNAWISAGVVAAGRGEIGKAAYYLSLIWTNGLFAYVVVSWLAKRLYRRGYNRLATGGTLRRRYGGAWLDRTLTTLVGFLDAQTRLLIVKDFRTFRRDPAQWGQILIFTGLMSFYFASMRRLFVEDMSWPFLSGISLLNLCAIGLLLSAYTGRFIYPMLSLEGRKFWILGLLPLRRERLIWGKFAFAATGGLMIAEFLVILSDLRLGMPVVVMALHALTVAVLAVGLSGLSVGLGACLPNFRETDPSKIAVGFGGTLNLLVGLAFLVVTVVLMAGPWHLYAAQHTDPPQGLGEGAWGMLLELIAGVALGAVAVVFPLSAGARALSRMEF